MVNRSALSGEAALTFLGENIPAIGPRFNNRDEALAVARKYLEGNHRVSGKKRETRVQIYLNKQVDGRYSMVVMNSRQVICKLNNLDELLLKRFRKGLKKKLFILTCFVDGENGQECLVLTEGLGAVFYTGNI
ncbi:MAG: hypothetical protein ACOX0T_09375 [Pelotomaculum sp.]|jgi:hypothetical protein